MSRDRSWDTATPSRTIIARHRGELGTAEHLASAHVAQWRAGIETPVTAALDAAREEWDTLRFGDTIVFDWPSARGTVEGHARVGN